MYRDGRGATRASESLWERLGKEMGMIGVSLLLAEVAIYNLFFVVKNRFKINLDQDSKI